MGFGFGRVGEEAGGFDDNLSADGGPVEVGGVALGEDLDFFAVDGDRVSIGGDVVFEVAEDGVVLEEVGEGCGGGEVIDGDEVDVGVCEGGAEDVAADAAEAVDAYLDCPCVRLLLCGCISGIFDSDLLYGGGDVGGESGG